MFSLVVEAPFKADKTEASFEEFEVVSNVTALLSSTILPSPFR